MCGGEREEKKNPLNSFEFSLQDFSFFPDSIARKDSVKNVFRISAGNQEGERKNKKEKPRKMKAESEEGRMWQTEKSSSSAHCF